MKTTKKVGTNNDKAERKGRSVFSKKSAVDANGASMVDEKGQLTGVPNADGQFDLKVHKPLGKNDFATSDVFMDFRAWTLNIRAARLTSQAEKLTTSANNLRKFGDDKSRKRFERLEKMREQIATLEAQFAAEGVEI